MSFYGRRRNSSNRMRRSRSLHRNAVRTDPAHRGCASPPCPGRGRNAVFVLEKHPGIPPVALATGAGIMDGIVVLHTPCELHFALHFSAKLSLKKELCNRIALYCIIMQPSTLIIVSHAVRFDRIELHDKQFARKIRGNDYLFGAQTKSGRAKRSFCTPIRHRKRSGRR